MKLTKRTISDNKYAILAFLIPIIIMFGLYLSLGIYWGSDRSILASDAFSQFSNFHASFNNVLKGKASIFYSWNAGLGLNYLSLISYYLGGVFTPIVFFFDNNHIPDALYILTMLKIASASLAFFCYAKRTFKISKPMQLALSITYSLMSFSIAHSEIIMWLDAFVYLPLITLGIDNIFKKKAAKFSFLATYCCLFRITI